MKIKSTSILLRYRPTVSITHSNQLESAMELSSSLQEQHAVAQNTILALESKGISLKNLPKAFRMHESGLLRLSSNLHYPTSGGFAFPPLTAGSELSSGETTEDNDGMGMDEKKGGREALRYAAVVMM